jgi:hypothetical protein
MTGTAVKRKRLEQQVPTKRVSTYEIVFSHEFLVGVEEVRNGGSPRFDAMDNWDYERGRLWATLAPRNMHPRTPQAIRLFDAAFERKYIR